MADTDTLEPVTVEQDGRILTGVGVTPEALQETVDARTKTDKPAVPAASAQSSDPVPRATDETRVGADRLALEADLSPDADTYTRDDKGQFKKQTRGQKRFDQLTAEREAEKRRADAAEARAAELEQRVRSVEPPRASRGVASATAESGSTVRPKPNENEVGTKYPTYADFIEDLADWKAEQKLQPLANDLDARIRNSIEADRATRTLQDAGLAVAKAARQQYADFDAVMQTSTTNIPNAIWSIIFAHEHAVPFTYALAKDANLAQRIAQNDPSAWLDLASRIPTQSAAPPASTPAPVGSTSAPAPYQPVGSGSKTTVPPLSDLAAHDDYDSSGYRERRAAQLKAVTRR